MPVKLSKKYGAKVLIANPKRWINTENEPTKRSAFSELPDSHKSVVNHDLRRFGKVTSTKLARFELIPKSALISLADRFELGIERKGEGAWNTLTLQNSDCTTDKAFAIERLSHCIHHCYDAIYKLIHEGDNPGKEAGEEDAGAILFAGAVLAEYKGIGKK